MTSQIPQHFHPGIEIHRDMVQIYCCRYDRIDTPQLLEQYQQLLSPTERRRWLGIPRDDAKQCFLLSRAMMRTLLGAAIGCPPDVVTIAEDARGKPFVEQPATRWQFNLSHSHGLIMLAIAHNTAVGVDIECQQRNTDILRLARHAFHPREILQLEALRDDAQRQHFFTLWTLKEAYIKALGEGLPHGLDGFAFTFEQADGRLGMHPAPTSIIHCWRGQPEPDFSFASIILSPSAEIPPLQLYDLVPLRHCTPRHIPALTHDSIDPLQDPVPGQG